MSSLPVVLVVDDEPDLLDVLALELEFHGFGVEKAQSGKEALEKLKAHSPAVILSDLRMPKGDGMALLREKNLLPGANPPLIFLSGYSDLSEEIAFAQGAAGYLYKPVDARILVQAIRRAILPPETRWASSTTDAPRVQFSATYASLDEARSRGEFNLGTGGFYCSDLSSSLRIEDVVQFSLNFGSDGQIFGHGAVRWVRRQMAKDLRPGYGIEIQYLEPESLVRTIKWVEALKPIAFIPQS